jgi:ribosome-binding protein aMBF1 (putative translation factor)
LLDSLVHSLARARQVASPYVLRGGAVTRAQQRARRAIGGEIRKARHAAGLTQRQLAARLRRSTSYVSRVELGARSITVAEFIRIARALRVDPVELLCRAGEMDTVVKRE